MHGLGIMHLILRVLVTSIKAVMVHGKKDNRWTRTRGWLQSKKLMQIMKKIIRNKCLDRNVISMSFRYVMIYEHECKVSVFRIACQQSIITGFIISKKEAWFHDQKYCLKL